MNRSHFWIPAADPKAAEEEFNRFLRAHRVLSVEEVFVANGAGSAWAVSVSWLDGDPSSAQSKGKIDYREILDAPTFELFASMRRWRRELSDAQGVPAYTVATNEQLAEIARRRAKSLEELQAISGLGKSRIDKYGATLVAWMNQALAEAGEGKDDAQPEGGE